MAIHDGVIGESSARKRSLGEIVGGNFGDAEGRIVVAALKLSRASARSANFAKTCAILGNARSALRTGRICIWRILIVRHQLPCCHVPAAK